MSDVGIRPYKPSAARLFGCTSGDMAQWCHERRMRMRCSSADCMHARYRDNELCLGHAALALREQCAREEFGMRLAMITGTTTARRLAAAIRERIADEGWQLIEWTAAAGIPFSSGSKAIRDPDAHMRTFIRIARHFGFERKKDGSFRKRLSRAA